MTTASGYSASDRFPKRLRPDLPLITCGKCMQKTVKEYRVAKEGVNNGRIFYKCPDRNVSYIFCHIPWLWLISTYYT